MMALGGGWDDEVMSEINMTPLVDVMLVLLIIFIITVPVLTHSVNLELPQADNTPSELKPGTVTLGVTAEGGLHWNNEPIGEAELSERLSRVAGQQPQPDVHIRADRRVQYEHVVTVMAAVQRAGIVTLGFITAPDP